MGYIYKITNIINNKNYIGKTTETIEKRFKRHLYYANVEQRDYPLSRAIRKYGEKNFRIEIIEEVKDELLSEREIFWINFYNSYGEKGYNATLGGDGTRTIEIDLVIKLYNEYKNLNIVSQITGYDSQAISKHLKRNNIKVLKNYEVMSKQNGLLFSAYDKNGILIRSFENLHLAFNWLKETNVIKENSNSKTICENIKRCLNGQHKFLYNYRWQMGQDSSIDPGEVKNNSKKKIKIYNEKESKIFNNSTEAAKWIIENNISKSKNIKSVKETIRLGLKENKIKYNYYWKFIE